MAKEGLHVTPRLFLQKQKLGLESSRLADGNVTGIEAVIVLILLWLKTSVLMSALSTYVAEPLNSFGLDLVFYPASTSS